MAVSAHAGMAWIQAIVLCTTIMLASEVNAWSKATWPHFAKVPNSFIHNAYLDHMFDKHQKTQEELRDPPIEFPTKTNVTLYRSFAEFQSLSKNPFRARMFQFLEHEVESELGGAFELARSVNRDPPDLEKSLAFSNKYLFNHPTSKKLLSDCVSRCPNADFYEPKPNLFFDVMLKTARNESIRRWLEAMPRINLTGSDHIDLFSILDTPSQEWLRQNDKTYERLANWSAFGKLAPEFERLWGLQEEAELVGNYTAADIILDQIDDVADEMERISPAGPMWTWARGFFKSLWDMENPHRWSRWTKDGEKTVHDLVEWFYEKFPGPVTNSGRFYYPPGSSREWHTNVYQGGVGWRAYIVRATGSPNCESGTGILHPTTGEVLYMRDSKEEMTLNVFRINDYRAPNWHCVYSRSCHRYSLGMKLTDEDVYRILVATGNAVYDPVLEEKERKWRAFHERERRAFDQEQRDKKRAHYEEQLTQALNTDAGKIANALARSILPESSLTRIVDGVMKRLHDDAQFKCAEEKRVRDEE